MEYGERHLERSPERVLDVGTGTGSLLELLHASYPHAGLTGVDIALNMCRRTGEKLGDVCLTVNADAECLPFRPGIFDLVVSASVLQWVEDLSATLHEMHRVVRPGGNVMVAFFSEGTLGELQHCIRDTVNRLCPERSETQMQLHHFRSVEDVTSIVAGMNFEKIVITVETEVDWYDDLGALLRSIKNIGAGTVSKGSGFGLGWRRIIQEASKMYLERYGRNGRIPATYKIIYLTAQAA